MSTAVLVNLDFGKNQILNVVAQVLSADPGNPVAGQFYYNSTSNTLRYYNGTSWVQLTASGTATDSNLLNGQAGTFYLSRANHSGSQIASTISDLASTVQGYRLDQFAAPTAAVNLGSQRLTSVADPTGPQDAATKIYVDAARAGLDIKDSVRAATTVNITLSGTQTVDGVALIAGDRILVKNQTVASANGIYIVAAGAWSRATDADSSAEVTAGMATFISEGATVGNQRWVLTTDDPITLGTTSLTFTQDSGGANYTAGTGITITGNTIAQDTASGYGVRKFTQAIGDGIAMAITVTHNLGTRDVIVEVYQAGSPYANVIPDIEAVTTAAVVIRFASAPTAGQYRVVVMG